MNFKAKKLLLILELNETMLFIKNERTKVKDFRLDSLNLKFDDKIDHYNLMFRKGKNEFLEYAFGTDRNHVDVAVWTDLDKEMAQPVCQKFFGRHSRDLLFVLPTNRELYIKDNSTNTDSLKIPRNLNVVFNNFPGYSSTNTLLLTCHPNTLSEYQKNDVVLPPFNPSHPDFVYDIGCYAVNKYIRGITIGLVDGRYSDVRQVNFGKPLQHLYKRYGSRAFSETEFR